MSDDDNKIYLGDLLPRMSRKAKGWTLAAAIALMWIGGLVAYSVATREESARGPKTFTYVPPTPSAVAAAKAAEASQAEAEQGAVDDAVAPEPGPSPCSNLGQNVEGYDTLAPGASRRDYLILLHKLQRDCPEEAAKRGLDVDWLPQCSALDQENCTMYRS